VIEKETYSDRTEDLRTRAEMIDRGKATLIPENLDGISPEETRHILHELRVHQIELEMQNEELRQAQAEFEVSQARYFDLYDLAPVGYFTLSEKGIILEANLTAAALLGVAKSTLLKQPLTRFILPVDQDIYYRHRKQLFETGEPQACEIRVMRADAAPCWVLVDAAVARDADDAPLCRAVMSDISQLKQAEEELRESETRFRQLAESSWEGILIHRDNIILDGNQTLLDMFGYGAEEAIGRNILDFIAPESTEKAIQTLMHSAGQSVMQFKGYGRKKDGNVFPIEALGRSIIYNNIPAHVTAVRDLTERNRCEETLIKSEEKYRVIFESITDVFYRTDNEGLLIMVSPSVEQLFGYVPDEVIGKKLSDFYVNPEERNQFLTLLREKGEVKGFEASLRAKNGALVCISTNARLYRDGQGRILGVQGVSRDVTKRKHAEEQLQQSLDNLRKALSTTVQVLASAVERRDPYTSGHQIRSADLARAIATEMGLSQEKIEGIRIAGSIHDIGKMSVPAEILSKPTKLTELEFSLIKEHARQGYEILKDIESSWPLAEIVYQHHERMDGSGYPRQLKGEEILMEARILAVADVVESMASYRPYRPAIGLDAALAEIENHKGTLYDADTVNACLRLFREKGYILERQRFLIE